MTRRINLITKIKTQISRFLTYLCERLQSNTTCNKDEINKHTVTVVYFFITIYT